MASIQKSVTIPENRRITLELELPESVPVGSAEVFVTIVSREKPQSGKTIEDFIGCLKDSDAFSGDPVELVRQWRDEW